MVDDNQYIVDVDKNGNQKWYKNGKLCKELTTLGLCAFYLNNKYHREDGPSVIDIDNNKYYYIYGLLHRENGPAIEYFDGNKEWYLFGKHITEEQYKDTIIIHPCDDLIMCEDKTSAYQLSKMVLRKASENFVNKFKLIKYISDKNNKWITMLLSAMADTDFTLTQDLIDVVLPYIDEEDNDLVQSSALALLYGGEKAVAQLMEKLIPEKKYRKIMDILFMTNPSFYSLTVEGQKF